MSWAFFGKIAAVREGSGLENTSIHTHASLSVGSLLHGRMSGRRGWSRAIAGDATMVRDSRAIICLPSTGRGPRRSGGCVRDCGWEHPRAQSTRWLWEERVTGAVLEFLEGARVECWASARVVMGLQEEEDRESEGGTGPALVCILLCLLLCIFSFVVSLLFLSVWWVRGEGEWGALIWPGVVGDRKLLLL